MIAHLARAAQVDEDGMQGRSVLPVGLRERLSRDELALAEWRALLAQARALRSLSKRAAPADLSGRVVAALNPGHQQERAIRSVQSMSRPETPEALDALVRRLALGPLALGPLAPGPLAPGDVSAPPVLEQLVQEEVADSQRSLVRRMTRRLERRRAPAGLARRLDTRVRGSRNPSGTRFVLPLVAMLVAVGLVWGLLRRLGGGGQVDARGRWPFEIQRLDSMDSADAMTRTLLDTMGGGMLGGG